MLSTLQKTGAMRSQPAYIKGLREIAEINTVRSHFGLRLMNQKKRKCLQCGDNFQSEGPQNRVCLECCKLVYEG